MHNLQEELYENFALLNKKERREKPVALNSSHVQ
jgi:hypothetical protein